MEPYKASSNSAPGWYLDPGGGAYFRWWDGEQWSSRTHPLAQFPTASPQSPNPPSLSDPGAANPMQQAVRWALTPQRRVMTAIILGGSAILIVLVVSIALLKSVASGALASDGPSQNWSYNDDRTKAGYYCGTIGGSLPGFAADTGSWDIGVYNWTYDTTGGEEACSAAISYFEEFFAYPNRGNILSTNWGDFRNFRGLSCFWSVGSIQSDMVDCFEYPKRTGHGFAGHYMAVPHSKEIIRGGTPG